MHFVQKHPALVHLSSFFQLKYKNRKPNFFIAFNKNMEARDVVTIVAEALEYI
jgi:hypothetical protein